MTAIVSEILSISPHPQSSKLKICAVSDGKNTYRVICGALNLRAPMKSIFAPIGSTLPSGRVVSEVELRGETSFGVLLSAKDLGISSETGIVDLPESAPLGAKWDAIPGILKEELSSIPWYKYQEVEAYYYADECPRIRIFRHGKRPSNDEKLALASKTYFDGENYCYRHFL